NRYLRIRCQTLWASLGRWCLLAWWAVRPAIVNLVPRGTTASDGCADAAVYRDDGAGDVGARPRGQGDRTAGHVVGPADPAQRSRVGDGGPHGLEGGGHHLRLNRPGGHGVDGDPPWAEFACEHPGHVVQPGLARRVGVRRERRHPQAVDAPDVDDPGRVLVRP